ncbi:MAG: preprotein translocase subunit YajC [Bacteroidia bacterium]
MLTILLQAPATTPAAGGAGSMMQFLLFPALLVIFWLFFIRPQNKRQQEDQKMRDGVKNGDKIVTIGGLHGVVVNVEDKTILLEVDKGMKLTFDKASIRSVVS